MIPSHLSYSSLTTWDRCPKSYELSRIRNAQAVPAWYFLGGTAVHKALDDYDTTGKADDNFLVYLNPEVRKAQAIDVDHKKWLSGGSEGAPVQGDEWMEIGPLCIENWKKFREKFTPEYIELDVTTTFPNGVEVKGFIDRVGEHVDEGHVIIDIKSGANPPKDKGKQLKLYAVMYMLIGGEIINRGGYFMARKNKVVWYDLDPVNDLKVFTEEFSVARRHIAWANSLGEFEAKEEFKCKFCEHQLNCFARSGDTARTRYYDPANPGHPEHREEEIPF